MISTSWADDFFSPPRLDPQPPPWIQDSDQDQDQNIPPTTTQPAPTESGPPPGFWGDEDDEEESTPVPRFSTPPRSDPGGKPKDSFMLTEPWNDVLGDDDIQDGCLGWGHPLLGVRMFDKQNNCGFVLDQRIEESRQQVRSLEDHTRSLVLKEVIQGKVDRVESKKFEQRYDLLMDVLNEAKREGCRCLN